MKRTIPEKSVEAFEAARRESRPSPFGPSTFFDWCKNGTPTWDKDKPWKHRRERKRG